MSFLANQGNVPSKTKEKIIPGDRMPDNELILASWVPALTNTIVPASIPIWLTKKNRIVFIGVRPMTKLMTKKGTMGINLRVKR